MSRRQRHKHVQMGASLRGRLDAAGTLKSQVCRVAFGSASLASADQPRAPDGTVCADKLPAERQGGVRPSLEMASGTTTSEAAMPRQTEMMQERRRMRRSRVFARSRDCAWYGTSYRR
ncbi:hypothetical protein JDV02_008714 [Purpureocillium takamizusanense]|uniref:Uncharacterized protein n=1 Tax=Purpureocillium takamizusanense TaxID=2060973 RepID=A0A9Q8QNF8_9HYPO|nr:uncharacterized protein JDV02_008714 [Purpureocillium takamizusanense]UNI22868.1 hypothetical protein JDV02_008714 [Purpureocillium takamizusanense]